MRFACQSCGKAYNLPEEKIADKSNVKLKCRVCGAIVEVKKQGEVVATILAEGETKRGRVSEAPPALTSMLPDDSDDATHAIAVSDQILSENASGEAAAAALMGHVKSALGQRGLAPLPPPAPTGFGQPAGFGAPPPTFGAPLPGLGAPAGFGGLGAASSSGLGSESASSSVGQGLPAAFAPTPVPPPLSAPDRPRADPVPPFPRPEGSSAALPPASLAPGPGSPPPPLPNAELGLHAPQNGGGFHAGNGAVPHFGEGAVSHSGEGAVPPFGEAALPDEPPPMAPVAMSAGGAAALSASAGMPAPEMGYSGPAPLDAPPAASSDDTTRKMLAALATGILIGFIIARLFF